MVPDMALNRRSFFGLTAGLATSWFGSNFDAGATSALAATGRGQGTKPGATKLNPKKAKWRMPAEDDQHDRTWMCWPSTQTIWGTDLRAVQDAILEIALTIAEFEPVSMLARPTEIRALTTLLKGVQLIAAPVDDLWARDTLPNFLTRKRSDGTLELGASHARFNGWGGKQISKGDTQLAGLVAKQLGIALTDSGLVGEGGGIEVDGTGTVLAAASCWVNNNRNPGRNRAQIEASILSMLGAQRMIWVDGLAGQDITDGHIDTLARFVNPTTILVDKPAYDDPDDPWVAVAAKTRKQVQQARTANGKPYTVVEINQPKSIRGTGDSFLSTYMNYYVCNGAVISPEFGDKAADAAAKKVLQGLFPSREVVLLNIDALAAGGGGIHCATQHQPATTK
jgi:agmatine deiminase